MAWTFERPDRKEDAPQPTTKATRRVDLDDGRWLDVRGGGSQIERRFVSWVIDLPVTARAEAVAAGQSAADVNDLVDAAVLESNAYLATFIADRVVDHNLTDADGTKLPLGLDLFWSLQNADVFALIGKLQNPPRVISDPKAESDFSGG